MSILIKANMNASEEDRLPDDELIAQISTLTLAAMDTTSNALARILSLLSENPEAQKRLRQEVTEAFTRHGGDLDFDSLNGLLYLDAVIKESLRYHTPIAYLPRQATCDTILPVGKPIKTVDGGEINEIFVPKGQEVFMSLFDCNRDPEIWGPDADQWKPDRWLSPLPVSVAEAHVPGIYSNLTTFIGGGRACIGFRFSLLEMKIVLSVLIQRFEFSPTGKKVVWLCNGVTQPTIEDLNLPDKGRNKTQLPLQIVVVGQSQVLWLWHRFSELVLFDSEGSGVRRFRTLVGFGLLPAIVPSCVHYCGFVSIMVSWIRWSHGFVLGLGLGFVEWDMGDSLASSELIVYSDGRTNETM
ncbi:hypothetical protein NMY22_g10615 [Coprinellus aureogranulatus]|nr:hypothetical protein NMY22_g10615 [Coprinellus aureogranulatus]